MYRSIFVFILSTTLLAEEPWGRDADMSQRRDSSTQCSNPRCVTPIIGTLAEKVIQFHQEVISPADGPRSHFIPSSSQYMLDAIRKYGFFKGFPMGCDRLLRENNDPWIYRRTLNGAGVPMKYDPVR